MFFYEGAVNFQLNEPKPKLSEHPVRAKKSITKNHKKLNVNNFNNKNFAYHKETLMAKLQVVLVSNLVTHTENQNHGNCPLLLQLLLRA